MCNINYSNDLTMLYNLQQQNKINLPINFYIFVLFQEVVGHILTNEHPDNQEKLLNTILYSMYFSSNKLSLIYEFLYV